MPLLFVKSDKKLNNIFQLAYNQEKALFLSHFFKTGPGQYGAGDKFIGMNMPTLRALAKDYQELNDEQLIELLDSPYHEVRMLGALIIVIRYQRAQTEKDKQRVLRFYFHHRKAFNNWDLVDLSVYKIWGNYLLTHPEKRQELYRFARSKKLWERRLAVVATVALIKAGEFKEILELSVLLLNDKEDLMHKAVGWMLREVGKKDKRILINFLQEYAPRLPRTTLRYAIERFPEDERKKYLSLKIKTRR